MEASFQGATGLFLPVQCDLQDESQILNMFEKIRDTWGGVDVCVNNAGILKIANAPLATGSTEEWRNMMDVSHTNVFLDQLFASGTGHVLTKTELFCLTCIISRHILSKAVLLCFYHFSILSKAPLTQDHEVYTTVHEVGIFSPCRLRGGFCRLHDKTGTLPETSCSLRDKPCSLHVRAEIF